MHTNQNNHFILELETTAGPPPEPPIISVSFFFLTSSSFSSDFSNGLMPTDYKRNNEKRQMTVATFIVNKHQAVN